ncbi:MAG: CpsB/CapC family capsule biosynthesis tyrosine phosphatase [Faecalibacillus faecis]
MSPVIAHVERYFKDSLDIERIQDFIDNGYLIQVNAKAFWDIMVNMLKSLLINY